MIFISWLVQDHSLEEGGRSPNQELKSQLCQSEISSFPCNFHLHPCLFDFFFFVCYGIYDLNLHSVFKRTIHPPPQNVNVFFFWGGGQLKSYPIEVGSYWLQLEYSIIPSLAEWKSSMTTRPKTWTSSRSKRASWSNSWKKVFNFLELFSLQLFLLSFQMRAGGGRGRWGGKRASSPAPMLRRSSKVLQGGKEKFYNATRMKCDIYYEIVINTEKSFMNWGVQQIIIRAGKAHLNSLSFFFW